MIKFIKSNESNDVMIGPASELGVLFGNWFMSGYMGRFMLPLFSTKPRLITKEYIENTGDPICFILKSSIYHNGLSLELMEAINKIWDEFYD